MRRNTTCFYTCLLILIGIALSMTLYLQLQEVKQQNNKLYLHPFAVSNAVKNIEVNLLLIAASHHQVDHSNTRALEQEVKRDLNKIKKQYLGEPQDIDRAIISITTWLKHPKEVNDKSTTAIYSRLGKIHTYASQKAKLLHEESQSVRLSFFATALLLAVYFLVCISFIYHQRIKKEKRLSRKLLNSKKRFEHLLNYTPNAVIIAAEDGLIIDASSQATTLFGYSRSEFKTLHITALIPNIYKEANKAPSTESTPDLQPFFQQDRHTHATLKNGEQADISLNVNIAAIDDEVTTLASIRDIREELAYKDKIFHQANYDFLTQLPNRSLAIDRFEQLRALAERNNEHIAVIFIDLDDFKKINDTLGHEMGDKLLINLAHRLSEHLRQEDTVARLGGDEFIILLRSSEPTSFFEQKVQEILTLIKGEFQIGSRRLSVSGSIGVALYPENGRNYSELLRKSDAAMYHSKSKGFNQYSFFLDSMSIEVSRRFAIEEEMLGALERHEFLVFFQPQVDLVTGKIIGAEALCRWNNKRLGHVTPDEFIPIAEYNGEIIAIGRHVLRESIEFTRKISETCNFDNFKISVNLSPRQFVDDGLIHFIKQALKSNNVPSNHLTLEVTEGALIDNDGQAINIFTALSDAAIELSMDDFGTGYSSLSYLRKYPFDHIKLDKTFVADITTNSKDLLSAAIAMAHALNLKVVAEGVETQDQLDVLRQLKCEYAQGYLFSPALESKNFFDFIENYDAQI